MSHELWRPVCELGYSDLYEVSNLGRVRSLKTGQVLAAAPQSRGYLSVGLHIGKPQKSFLVHRLVAGAWLDPASEGRVQVNHKDGNKQNNVVSNLEWCTSKENHRHAIETGLIPKQIGHESPNAKLTAEQVRELRRRPYSHGSYREWAVEFGVSETAAKFAHKGRTYRDI